MPNRFEGAIVAITGAASGIGLATATRFISEGATVYAGDINQALLLKASEELGRRYIPIELDVTNAEQRIALLEKIEAEQGLLDCLVNNAGGSKPQWVKDSTQDVIEYTNALNLTAPILLTKLSLELLYQSANPSVINICSISAKIQMSYAGIYGATKAGLESFTRHCAKEIPSVRFNAVLPGYTLTAAFTDRCSLAELNESTPLIAKIPAGRWATPDDIAGPILFLASRDASYITGSSLVVDGGLYCSTPVGG